MTTDRPDRSPGRDRCRCWPWSAGPNVGKSTLVNRILGRREAVVEDVPGVTRDRVSYDATWAGRAFTVVDTGGWDPDARGLAERIKAQAEIAVGLADAVLFVVDATVGHHRRRRGRRPRAAEVAEAGDPGREQGRRPAHRGRGLRPVEPRPRRALPRLGAARPRLRRPARRHPRGAARAAGGVVRGGGRAAPGRDRRQAQRRQVVAAQPARRLRAGRRRLRRRHDRRPGRRAGRARRPRVAVHRHRRHPQAGQGGLGPRVLRLAAHLDRDRPGRGRRAGPRRRPVASPSRTCGSCRRSATPAGRS